MNLRILPALLAVLSCTPATLPAQVPGPVNPAAADPFLKDANPANPPVDPTTDQLPQEMCVRMEIFSLTPQTARKMMRRFPKSAQLYAWIDAELEKEGSEVKLENLTMLKTRSGRRSKVEALDEFPYATEFDPPQIPQSMGIGMPAPALPAVVTPADLPAPAPTPPPPMLPAEPVKPAAGPQGDPSVPGAQGGAGARETAKLQPWPHTVTTPTSFSIRNTGTTLELELYLTEDGKSADINLAPDISRLASLIPMSPSGEVLQPVFETTKQSSQVLARIGNPTFVGTLSQPVATGAMGGNTESRTRLLFITVTAPR